MPLAHFCLLTLATCLLLLCVIMCVVHIRVHAPYACQCWGVPLGRVIQSFLQRAISMLHICVKHSWISWHDSVGASASTSVRRMVPSWAIRDRQRTRAISLYLADHRGDLFRRLSDADREPNNRKRNALLRLARQAFHIEVPAVQRRYYEKAVKAGGSPACGNGASASARGAVSLGIARS